jgi:hypothetical protein
MLRSAVRKVMWVGRATSAVVGLALVLALLFGVATAAFGADGDNFILGQTNVATLVTRLAGPDGVNGAMFEVQNNDRHQRHGPQPQGSTRRGPYDRQPCHEGDQP